MGILKKLLIFFFVIAGSALVTAILFFWLVIRTPQDPRGQNQMFKIEPGESAQSIARRLQDLKIIKSAFYFKIYSRLSLRHQSLKRGEYELSPRLSIREITDIIFEGEANEIAVTIPEGLNLGEVENIFVTYGLMKKGDLEKNIKLDAKIMNDKPANATLEGYLFPDTYKFYKDSPYEDSVAKMVYNLGKKITDEMLLKIKSENKTFFQILTMASLIEKEVKNDADRQIVSGILWKRLKIGMPLQVDATLVYITGRKTIYESDKRIKSPYNTYFYPGLPKGPIANPGLASIVAAINPAPSSYLYYLHTRDGKTVYSVTLEDHNRAKAIYPR